MIRLETPTRYYLVCAQRDLLGHWEVWRAWGGKGSGLGNCMKQPARDEAHAQQLLAEVLQAREAHGYVAVGKAAVSATGPGPDGSQPLAHLPRLDHQAASNQGGQHAE